jgi:hypothetical protein
MIDIIQIHLILVKYWDVGSVIHLESPL